MKSRVSLIAGGLAILCLLPGTGVLAEGAATKMAGIALAQAGDPAVQSRPDSENIPDVKLPTIYEGTSWRFLRASSHSDVKLPTIHAGSPCCAIASIAGDLVTASETATGKTFQFQVNDRALLKSLRVGQKVHADFGTQKVSVNGIAPCCAIVATAGGQAGGAKLPSVKLPTIYGAVPCCNVVANAALKGRLGRLVVAFPAGANPKGTRIAVLKDGQEVRADYGSQNFELLSGTYVVKIAGKTVPNVTVQAGHDTNVKVGVLRVSVGKGIRAAVLDGGQEIAGDYGNFIVGLPAGAFEVKASGQTRAVTISAGQITDF